MRFFLGMHDRPNNQHCFIFYYFFVIKMRFLERASFWTNIELSNYLDTYIAFLSQPLRTWICAAFNIAMRMRCIWLDLYEMNYSSHRIIFLFNMEIGKIFYNREIRIIFSSLLLW